VSWPVTRRALLQGAGYGLGTLLLPVRFAPAKEAWALPAETLEALQSSQLVYVSPLNSDGGESQCHGEVWYFWDQGAVVLATSSGTWKAKALAQGLDRARIWVGDFDRGQKGSEGPFRQGPTFLTKAERDTAPATFERLFEAFGKRYAEEWGKWGPRFRSGYADGSRILIRYTPEAA
jgi:hypothetical protein